MDGIIQSKMRMKRMCPACQQFVEEKWTLRGFLQAIFCFPCGLWCSPRRKRLFCPHCKIDVIVADGSIPRIVQTYKFYKEYKRADLLSTSSKSVKTAIVNEQEGPAANAP